MTEDPPAQPPSAQQEITFLDLLLVLAKHKRFIVGFPVVAAVVTAAITFLMPNVYTAVARILPPQQNQSSAAAILGQLGGIGGLAGATLGLKNPNDLYVGMLKSRTVADNLIEKFKLQELYEQNTLVETRKALEKMTGITSGADGIIVIEVDDEDPQRAATMANAYVEELDRLNDVLAVTEAGQRRVFFEKQLAQARDQLAQAEVALKQTQEATGMIKLDEQGKAIIEAFAELKAQIAAKEVQIGSMRTFATEQNPDLVRAQQELSGLRGQLKKLEQTNPSGDGDILVPTGKVPEIGLEYLRKYRDVKYFETVFELLAKQFELAKLDEAKDASLIQVLDHATPPDKKSKPRRSLIVLLAILVALFGAIFWAFVREARAHAAQVPGTAEKLNALRVYFREGWWRSRPRLS